MEKPYGEWQSPITTEMMVADSVRLSAPAIDGGNIYWLEGRPAEGGRNVLVRNGRDVTRVPFNVRSRAHEYGGGAFLAADDRVWFVNFADQRIYGQADDAAPAAVTPPAECRYADLVPDTNRDRLICVRENHAGAGAPVNEIVSVDLAGGAVSVLAGGHDFCSTPALSPDGTRLAWLTWDHPNMPWDETELWLAEIRSDGSLDDPDRIAGGDGVSVFQPCWAPSGELWFVADPTGWWNLQRWDGSKVSCPLKIEAEFGLPQWVFGMRTYGFAEDGSVVCAYSKRGEWRAGRFDPGTGDFHRLGLNLSGIEGVAVAGNQAVFLGGSPRRPTAVIRVDLATGAQAVLRSSLDVAIDDGYISEPERIDFATGDGETAHAFFYPPTNSDCQAPYEERPPLIAIGHGGPTASTSTALALKIQFWTSRNCT